MIPLALVAALTVAACARSNTSITPAASRYRSPRSRGPLHQEV